MTAKSWPAAVNSMILIAALFAAWQILFEFAGSQAMTAPAETFRYLGHLLTTETFWGHVEETSRAFFFALLLAVLLGLIIGFLLGAHRFSSEVFEPVLVAFYSIPKITLYPIILLAFGKPDSPIKTIADLKGKKIGYTNPRSTSQALDILLLEAAGLKPDDAELVKTGGFGEAVVALNLGLIDASAIADPVWSKNKSQFRVLVSASDVLPPLCNVIGVTTGEAAATRGDFIRAILRGRRKAVEFMSAHPDEAADIVAKAYNLDVEVAKSTINNLVAPSKSGVPYWSAGNFDFAGMDRMIRAQKLVGALSGDVDWSKIVDTSFLADDLKPKK